MRQSLMIGGALAALVVLPAFVAEPALQRAVNAPTRTPAFVARDPARHPVQELTFFHLTPRSTVVELWPGGGYWTQILAPLLHDHGTYYVAMGAADGDKMEQEVAPKPAFLAMLAAHPQVYGHVHLTTATLLHPDLAPPGTADVVLTFRNLHNWMNEGDAPQMLAAIRAALKPGGVLGVEDHRANTKTPQDPKATSGYVRQDYAEALIERAGFTLVGASEMDANPRDTADYPGGVWTLPPTLMLGAKDRAKYLAIGEADNFVLAFRKTGS